MGLLDGLEKLINEHGSAAILKERITLANDKHAALEAKVTALEAEKTKLHKEIEDLRLGLRKDEEKIRNLENQLSHNSSLKNYVEEAGALFKKNPDGTYNQTPYCPACQTAMVSPGRHELFRCGKKSCGQFASFDQLHLGDVIVRLP